GITDHTLHPLARVHIFLDCNFIESSLLKYSSDIYIRAFRVFAHHHEVDTSCGCAFERTKRIIQASDWTDVCIQIHLETHAQANVFSGNSERLWGTPQWPDKNAIEVASNHGKPIRGNGCSLPEIALGRPVNLDELPFSLAGFNYFLRLRNHFLANAVA